MRIKNLLKEATSKHQKMQFEEAAALYKKLLVLDPRHLDGNFCLGTLKAQQGDLVQAEKYLLIAANIDPSSPMVKVNLGNVYKSQGRNEEAIECFQRAIELNPKLIQAHFGLGSALMYVDMATAKQCFYKVLSLNPNIAECHYLLGKIHYAEGSSDALNFFNNAKRLNPKLRNLDLDLGKTHLRYKDIDRAQESLNLAQQQDPENVEVKFLLAVAQGVEPDPEVKEAYVKSEFDKFAPHFDSTLEALSYKPLMVVDAIRECFGNNVRFNMTVDLGCGTGLSGKAIKDHTCRITGIDISPKMLELAAEKGCYELLVENDIANGLSHLNSKFDLFMAADVFVYVGELRQVFKGIRSVANAGAVVAFTTESIEGDTFCLQPSGRYAHSTSYIRNISDEFQFDLVYNKRIRLRREGTQWIDGDIYLLQLRC